jgi:hypothetical protein
MSFVSQGDTSLEYFKRCMGTQLPDEVLLPKILKLYDDLAAQNIRSMYQ